MDFFERNENETGDTEPVSFDEYESEVQPQKEYLPEEASRSAQKRIFRRGMAAGMLLAAVIIFLGYEVGHFAGVLLNGGFSVSTAVSSESGDAQEVSLSTVLDSDALAKIETLLELLDYYYYDYDSVTVSQLQESIYAGIVAGVDDAYTQYYTAEEQENVEVSTSGSYSGIGAGITVDGDTDWPMISYTYADSPAEEAGLKAGDLILEVDGVEVTSETSTSEVASMIRGEAGTTVHVVVQRGSIVIETDITRADIDTPTVTYEMLENGVGYIYIVQFSSNTEEQFAAAYEDLVSQGMMSMILDLRYNGGGTVSSCVEIMDDILPEGITLTMEDASGEITEYTSDADCIDMPIALLVNGSTASASEIVTAALMDYEYATVIGTTTYGKGVYQQSFELSDGSGIKITAGKFYSPLGYNYNGVGIEPDIVLEYENTAGEDADYSVETDNQIQKAIEVLTGTSAD